MCLKEAWNYWMMPTSRDEVHELSIFIYFMENATRILVKMSGADNFLFVF
jgi:hypothetical protein